MDSKRRWLAASAVGLSMLAGASTAQAESEIYHPSTPARSFDSGPAGWTESSTSSGPCVPLNLCPTITNSYQPTGGAEGGGYIRTELGPLLGVDSTSTGTWRSPTFEYRGVSGAQPDQLSMNLARRADVDAFAEVSGNQATYSVSLRDVSNGQNVAVIQGRSLSGSTEWAEIPTVSVDPTLLTIGHSYRISITSRFESGSQLLPRSTADYDRVRLQARTFSSGGGGGGTGGGGDSFFGKGGGKATVTAVKRRGDDQLRVTVRCARRPDFRCKARIAALLSKGGAQVTSNRTVRVRQGQKRRVSVDITTRYQDEVANRKRIVIKLRSKLRGDSHAKTTYKKLRIRNG